MGADRVIVDIAAINEYGKNVIVFDLGTALTMDLIVNYQYVNGYIFPGLRLMKESLANGTSLLENFEFKNISEKKICDNTLSQINDAILLGIFGVINQYLFENQHRKS